MARTAGARRAPDRLTVWTRLSRGDRLSLLALVAFPLLLDVPWSLAGEPMLPGDDLTQNYPLRVLAGELIRAGHLPVWDPFIWSGTPLLAGWNAGAMFPGSWLFAILPGVAAWTVNLVAVGIVCGTGTYVLLRRLRCRPLAACLASLAFTYAGFMSGQVVHIGLVQGTALLPWMLVAVDGLAARRSHRVALDRQDLAWVVLLAAASALAVLAGDPRAISTAVFAVAVQLLACWWRDRSSSRHLVAGVAAAAVLGAALSAVQWLPGLRFLHASQRGVSAYNFFGSGSLSPAEIGSLLTVPFLTGGNGNFGQPLYFGSYNLPETTIGVGLLALVAAFAYLPDVLASIGGWARRKARPTLRARPHGAAAHQGRRVGVWYATGLTGVLLTLGTDTPLGHLLVHIPLYGGERLQNRNAVMLDLALAVLLAFFLDDLIGTRVRAGAGGTSDHLPPRGPLGPAGRRALALVPIAGMVALVVYAYVAPISLQAGLGVIQPNSHVLLQLTPYLVATLALGLAISLLVLSWHRVGTRAREGALVALVLADVAMYVTNAGFGGTPEQLLATTTPASAALSRYLGAQGRFAIYNPDYYATGSQADAVDEVGVTDINVLRHLATVQGYGSIVQGDYEDATGTHQFEALDESGLAGSTFDTLDLRTLLTLPGYFQEAIPPHSGIPVADGQTVTITGARAPAGDTPALPASPSGPWTLAPHGSSSWLLASTSTVVRATIVLDPQLYGRPRYVDVGLQAPGGALHAHRVPVANGIAELKLPAAERAERLVVTNTARTTAVVGAVVVVTRAPDERLLLDGTLQGVLQPPHWEYAGALGPYSVLTNTAARGLAWLEPPGSTSPDARRATTGSVTTGATLDTGAQTMHVTTSRRVLLVRSETYAAGWTARIERAGGGAARMEAVRPLGLVQAVEIPAGDYVVTWRYAPGGIAAGLALSATGAAALAALTAPTLLTALRRRPPRAEGGPVA